MEKLGCCQKCLAVEVVPFESKKLICANTRCKCHKHIDDNCLHCYEAGWRAALKEVSNRIEKYKPTKIGEYNDFGIGELHAYQAMEGIIERIQDPLNSTD